MRHIIFALVFVGLPQSGTAADPDKKSIPASGTQARLNVHVSWGHESPARTPFEVRFLASEVAVAAVRSIDLEADELSTDVAWDTTAGGGDVDGVEVSLVYSPKPIQITKRLHRFWADFIDQSDADTARRLRQDPAYRLDARSLTVQMNAAGTRGFTVTVGQLLENKALWIPSLDIYLAAGDPPMSFADHSRQLVSRKGRRILDRIHTESEASYEQYTARWEDMGSPDYAHPAQPAPGHIVCLTWDSAIHKFGVDRGAGVWNDYGNPDRLRFWYGFGDLTSGIRDSWRSQELHRGLPVITTIFEEKGLRWEVEEFAYPLEGPPPERRGDMAMVLLQRVVVANLEPEPKTVSLPLNHRRQFSASDTSRMIQENRTDAFLFQESGKQRVLFSVEGAGLGAASCVTTEDAQRADKKEGPCWKDFRAVLSLTIPGSGTRDFVVKLPSPMVLPGDRDRLLALEYAKARSETLKYWSDYVARGAQFRVPEKVVNDLFRAGLWHALRLPRRHGGNEEGVRIDLPYSNFAYQQNGTPWPVNQAVYVDYMIYDLRGYHDLSVEELLTVYRNNQEPNGRVGGYADWGVYTPSMIYVVAKHYLLSGDRDALDRLLPPTLRALDWCLDEIRRSSERPGPAGGLVRAPLNDGTGEGVWAFTQAYVCAGLESLGRALRRFGHPRARECLEAARTFRESVQRAFSIATVRSPLVQLRDHSWIPYVPCEATRPGRLFEQWYPTDVDTGATHLLRLRALPATGAWGDSLLHDHEDNLYWKGWGMANEPVYNPQATAYLLRDDPKAAIRAFYSYMACAFSHSALEPVEHRWTWGQYFGPPSTDGAWFELYRHMLIHELEGDTLLLLQATPRRWLENGKRIEVERAPTYYGEISFAVVSAASEGRLLAKIQMPARRHPETLLVRLRHPGRKPIRSATVNGRDWRDFDVKKEWVRIRRPDQPRYSVVARY